MPASARRSPGRPRTRSPRMLRITSDVPPFDGVGTAAQVPLLDGTSPVGIFDSLAGFHVAMVQNPFRPKQIHAELVDVADSVRRRRACRWSPPGPVRRRWPWPATAPRLGVALPSAATAGSAGHAGWAYVAPAGPPHSETALRDGAQHHGGYRCPPSALRSFISVVIATAQPLPTSPRRCASGMRASVKYTSLNSA